MTQGQHEEAMDLFLDGHDYLSKSNLVAVAAMELARELDENWRTQAYAELLRTIRYIESLNPTNEKETDDEDDLLSPNR